MVFKRVIKLLMLSMTLVFLVACTSEDIEETVSVTTTQETTEETTVTTTETVTTVLETTVLETTASTSATTTTEVTTEETSIYVPSTIEEVAQAYNEVINQLKQEQNLIITKYDDVVFEISYCSVLAVKTLMNTFIQSFINGDDISYDFTNATTSDGIFVNSVIYPSDRQACVTADDLAIVTATATDGGYSLYLQIKEEYITSDGTDIQEPASHYTALDIVANLPPLDEAPIEISKVDAYFSGAIIEVQVGADGKVQSIRAYQPLEGTGFGEITIFTVEVTMGGSVDSFFTITYK